MVNVDELNEEIKQFGVVVEKMKDLPEIYEKVQIQLDVCREASNELKIAREDMTKFVSETAQTLDQHQKETETKLTSIEHNLNQQIDKSEGIVKDRVSLAESNLSLALTNLTHNLDQSEGAIKERVSQAESSLSLVLTNLSQSVESIAKEFNQRMDSEAAENKKRFIIITVGVCLSIILGVIGLFI